MNDKFFSLPAVKQQNILNAAYQVFSRHDYKKAPMIEISEEGNISKALLFHYFKNKKELYLYLYQYAMELTAAAMEAYQVTHTTDLFEMLERNLKAKCSLIQRHPYICAFCLKAYYENDPTVKEDIKAILEKANNIGEQKIVKKIDYSLLRQDIDFSVMLQSITFACDGGLHQAHQSGKIDANEIEKNFMSLIGHWKKIYARSEQE